MRTLRLSVSLVVLPVACIAGCFGGDDNSGGGAGFDAGAADASFPEEDATTPDAPVGPLDAASDVAMDSPLQPVESGVDAQHPVDAGLDSPVDGSIDGAADSSADAPSDSLTLPDVSVDAALAYPQVVLADNPLSYWRFGEASGTTAVDQKGATNGTYNGGVTLGAPGAIANDPDTAATFDGTSGYVDMGAGFVFSGTAAMSYEAWVKPNPADPAARRFMSKETNNGSRQGFLMAYEQSGANPDGGAPNNLLSWERWLNGSNDSLAAVVTPSVYQHVVVTYDGATMAMYLNGQLVGTTPSTRSILALTNYFMVATYSTPAAADCFGGTIDEVAIYDHALTAASVALHYQVGSGM